MRIWDSTLHSLRRHLSETVSAKPGFQMPTAAHVTVDEIFWQHLWEFYQLAFVLSGDTLSAEKILADTYERARAATYVEPDWHTRWVKHCLISASVEHIRTLNTEASSGKAQDTCWGDSLPAPFCANFPRILFVLRIWEGISTADTCRYCGLSRTNAEALLLDTWTQIRSHPECLTEFAARLQFPFEQVTQGHNKTKDAA
jgi:hypothetical protein